MIVSAIDDLEKKEMKIYNILQNTMPYLKGYACSILCEITCVFVEYLRHFDCSETDMFVISSEWREAEGIEKSLLEREGWIIFEVTRVFEYVRHFDRSETEWRNRFEKKEKLIMFDVKGSVKRDFSTPLSLCPRGVEGKTPSNRG